MIFRMPVFSIARGLAENRFWIKDNKKWENCFKKHCVACCTVGRIAEFGVYRICGKCSGSRLYTESQCLQNKVKYKY